MNNPCNDGKGKKKPKTVSINAKFKELYYQAIEPLKESPDAIKHRHTFWNYMMNISMQNAVTQL